MADPKIVPFGPAAVKAALDAAPVVAPAPTSEAEAEEPRWGGPGKGLPPDCPVTPLGVAGLVRCYLDEMQQLHEIAARDHSRLVLQALFGRRSQLLYDYWPRHSKEGDVTGWRPELGAEALMAAASAKGVIDLYDKIRGAGAWLGDDGELVLHCGDQVLVGAAAVPGEAPLRAPQWRRCGEIGRHVYPAAAAKPRPSDSLAPGGVRGPAADLLALLQSWNWRRPEVDPYLLLGWIGAAMVGGALAWRPAMWLTGDRATGKSTLQELLKLVFGEGGLFSLADATQAGISQYVKHSSLPVALDELEADEDNRRAKNIIALAKLAASGGQMARGGADHSGHTFTVRFCILFSSILIPPLAPQDRSRLAILELDELAGAVAPALHRGKLRALGAQLRRRLVDHWHRFPAALDAYRGALAAAGHTGRGADQYGTLLACQELLLHDSAIDSDSLAAWGDQLRAATLAASADDLADHERCLTHILSSPVDAYRGGQKRTIAQWIEDALDRGRADQPAEANAVLGAYGLQVVLEREVGGDPLRPPLPYLCVANTHQGLAQLMAGTHWAGRSGASAVYVQALRRVAFATPGVTPATMRFGAVPARYTKLPLECVLPDLVKG